MLLQRIEIIKDEAPTVGFNTASGKCCCNWTFVHIVEVLFEMVSIPQAVSAVATLEKTYNKSLKSAVSIPQAVSAVATD